MTVNNDNGTAAFCVFANNTLTEPSEDQGLIGGAARVYNCTVVGAKNSGRVTSGKSGYSLNTIYFGGEAVYGASTLEKCVIYGCADTGGVSVNNKVADPVLSREAGDYHVDRRSPCVGYATVAGDLWKVFDGAMDGALAFDASGFAVVGAYQETVSVGKSGMCVFVR